MKVQYSGFVARATSPASEILSSLSAVDATTPVHLLGYTPVARLNPYQGLLYKGFADRNFAVAPILKPETFRDLGAFRDLAASTTLHLHWNSWMTFNEPDRERARTLGIGMVGRMQKMREMGIHLVWTVHNLYPHDAQHVDVELEIQQRIADTSDTVHLMSRSSMRAISEYVEIDESKALFSPHPSYAGAYPDVVTRAEARAMLGIAEEEVVFLMFGALKPYKGLTRLLKSFDLFTKANASGRYRLLVAGAGDGTEEAEVFIKNCLAHPNVLIESSKIPNDRAQIFLRASDIGLANYSRTLNSGASLLYHTFDLPVVAAEVLSEALSPAGSVIVTDESVDAFVSALEKASEVLVGQEVRKIVRDHMRFFDPETVSRNLADQLMARVRGIEGAQLPG